VSGTILVEFAHRQEIDMPRIDGRQAEGASERVQTVYAGIERVYGRMLEPVSVTAHSETILDGYLAFERGMRKAGALDRKLKELANLKTATLIGCPFCIDIGSAESQEAGVTAEQVAALHEHETSDAFSETERLVLDYAVAMSRTPLAVEDALFARLRAGFSDEQLVELTATVAWENYRSRFNHAMGIKAHGFAEHGVCALPAP
jgi:AhpD family alkylhydroperoxidase